MNDPQDLLRLADEQIANCAGKAAVEPEGYREARDAFVKAMAPKAFARAHSTRESDNG